MELQIPYVILFTEKYRRNLFDSDLESGKYSKISTKQKNQRPAK